MTDKAIAIIDCLKKDLVIPDALPGSGEELILDFAGDVVDLIMKYRAAGLDTFPGCAVMSSMCLDSLKEAFVAALCHLDIGEDCVEKVAVLAAEL